MRHPSHVWAEAELAQEPLNKLVTEYIHHLRGRPQPVSPELGFVHFIDRRREAGYRGLTPHLPERVSHGSPAERDCTRAAGV